MSERRTGAVRLALWLVCLAPSNAWSVDLQQQIDSLQPGAEMIVPAGTYGRLTLRVPDTEVRCDPNAIIDGGGQGHAVRIMAPGTTLSGCTVRNWGADLNVMDAGIFVGKDATSARIVENDLQGPAFGIWLDATRDVLVKHNRVEGQREIRSQDRGNGIHMYNTSGARIEGNSIESMRDGIYIETSNGNSLINNQMSNLRFGIHYMYSHDNLIQGNTTTATRTGYALMQSRDLRVINNRSIDDENYGILMNFITHSVIQGNQVSGVSQGQTGGVDINGAEGKAVFIYNSLYNVFTGNTFRTSGIGIHLTAGSEENEVYDNAFIDNRQQVKYVATRKQEWSQDGRGNYWSDYLGWDRDHDGIGDILYEPNDQMDKLLWLYPQARLLMHSPAVETLRWVQQAFPVLQSPGVSDNSPLMSRPENADAQPGSEDI